MFRLHFSVYYDKINNYGGISMHRNIKKVLINQEQLEKRVLELSEQINKDYKGETVVFVGLLNGSVPFLWDLIKNVSLDCEIDFMDVTSYQGTSSTGEVRILKDLTRRIADRHVIIVEDIIDTGRTLKVVKGILENRNPKSLKIMSLLDKKEGRVVEINGDYIGFDVPDEFVVGYGLDYNELYRNLKYVGILKEECYM